MAGSSSAEAYAASSSGREAPARKLKAERAWSSTYIFLLCQHGSGESRVSLWRSVVNPSDPSDIRGGYPDCGTAEVPNCRIEIRHFGSSAVRQSFSVITSINKPFSTRDVAVH